MPTRTLVIIAICIALAALGLAWLRQAPVALSGLEDGPDTASTLPSPPPADWRDYTTAGSPRLAILLTEPRSAWLGLAHGLRTIGIPFTLTDDVEAATEHEVVLVYPVVSGATLDAEELGTLRDHVESGGTLFATQVLGGGLQDLFGFTTVDETRTRHAIAFDPGQPESHWIGGPREREVRIGNPDRPETWIGTQAFSGSERVLARYDDGAAAMIARQTASGGTAYALGFDLGFFLLKAYGDRDGGAWRDYVNGYEPSADVWLRWLLELYHRHEPMAVSLDTVPGGADLSLIVSFDIDYSGSARNMLSYARMLDRHGVSGTFFVQTKYFRDYFDSGFFDTQTVDEIERLAAMGMEIASHSVSHSDIFASLPAGTGQERYPGYQPRVRGEGDTEGASVLGELRISRHLLEQASGEQTVSFRPGYLATPDILPEALQATGYRYSSSITSGNALTHLPYRQTWSRGYDTQSSIFEFPVSIEDERPVAEGSRLAAALALADDLSRYGGLLTVLVHPTDTTDKLDFLDQLIGQLNGRAWTGSLAEFGDWWSARDRVEVSTAIEGNTAQLTILAPAGLSDLALRIPTNWRPAASTAQSDFRPGQFVIEELEGRQTWTFFTTAQP